MVSSVSKDLQTKLGWGIAAWLFAASWLLYFHFSNMLAKPHYQFVLLVPPAIALLLWNRSTQNQIRLSEPPAYQVALFMFPLSMLAVSAWFFSPWIAMASLVVLIPITCVGVGGWALLRSTWGIWLLAGFLLPLPLRADERLIVQLREYATKATSRLLDYFGVLHMVSGNVIELPEKKLFVADACSGIHSLFVLLAAGAIIAAWNRRGPLATLMLLMMSFGLVMIENVLRLLTVCASIRLGYDLSEGTPHKLLGFVLFAVSIAMLLSADQLIAFFTFWRPANVKDVPVAPQIRGHQVQAFVYAGCAAILLLPIQWLKSPKEVPNLAAGFSSGIELPEFGEAILPEDLQGFKRVGYERVERVPEDPFGHHSQIWRYSNRDTEITISLNYSYQDVHDACLCYRNTGWEVSDEKVIGVPDDGLSRIDRPKGTPLIETPLLIAPMHHSLQGHGLLLYSVLSESGKVAVGIDSRKLGTTLGQAAGRFGDYDLVAPENFIQLQVVANQADPFLETERQSLTELYRDVQAILYEQALKTLN